jgi:uncharacterized membrane protein
MDSASGQNNKRKNIVLGILAGIVCAIGGFFVGTVATFLLMAIYFNSIGTFSDMGPLIAIVISPIIGVLTAIVIGIPGGWWIYKRISARQ